MSVFAIYISSWFISNGVCMCVCVCVCVCVRVFVCCRAVSGKSIWAIIKAVKHNWTSL